MMIVLLIAGICAVVAGLLAIAFGIPVQEFSFGNTLILAGVVGVCTGIIVLAQVVVVRELKNIARRLGPRSPADSRPRPALAPAAPVGEPADEDEDEFLFSRNLAARAEAGPAPGFAPPWRDEAPARDRPRQEAAASPPELAQEGPPPRRHRLFSSTVRKDRAQPRLGEAGSADRPAPEDGEVPPANFEDAWPKPERRPPEPPQRRGGRGPSAEADADERPRDEDQPAVTVIKSGVVDGMAYSLYSDGSIEAQMPEGMMRFASIDELRAHLDQRL